ncbi:MAG TPA: cytochrome c biogenesis protein CcdA [Microbacterium sp.]|nr:cytochrome c biogenesis protein CcdA [Microbacterium sp.]
MNGVVAAGALWLAVPIAILAGLVSFLSPCVLPLVPGYLGFIGGAVSSRGGRGSVGPARSRLVLGVLLFIAGFTVVFMAVNIFGGTVGLFFVREKVLITRIMGAVVIFLGLVFIGLFSFAQRNVRPQVRSSLGLFGAPLLGLALGIGWAPCIGPTLSVILSMSMESGSAWRGAVLGLAYSLGLGIPFLLIALGFGWATRSVAFLRRHIRAVNLIGGGVLVVLGILMVTGVWSQVTSDLVGVIQGVTPAI